MSGERSVFVVLAHEEDRDAAGVAASLRARHGERRVVVATSTMLSLARRLSHRLGSSEANTTLELHNGVTIDATNTRAVLNRLRRIDAPAFAHAAHADVEYALNELYALQTAWLAALPCRVINRPIHDLPAETGCGWLTLAARHGLPVRHTIATTKARCVGDASLAAYPAHAGFVIPHDAVDATIARFAPGIGPAIFGSPLDGQRGNFIVAGTRTTGACPRGWTSAARSLADHAGLPLLRVHHARVAGDSAVVVHAIERHPSLLNDEEVQAVIEMLEEEA